MACATPQLRSFVIVVLGKVSAAQAEEERTHTRAKANKAPKTKAIYAIVKQSHPKSPAGSSLKTEPVMHDADPLPRDRYVSYIYIPSTSFTFVLLILTNDVQHNRKYVCMPHIMFTPSHDDNYEKEIRMPTPPNCNVYPSKLPTIIFTRRELAITQRAGKCAIRAAASLEYMA